VVRVLVFSSDGDPGPHVSALRSSGLAVHAAEHGVSVAWIEQVNPHLILSVGSIPDTSVLWELPLWRRRLWLNIPDLHVAPFAVRQSLLSLMASNIEPRVYGHTPAVTVWSGRSASHELARGVSEARETYDNWHVDTRNGAAQSGLLDAMSQSRDGLVWPVDESFLGTETGTMRLLVEAWQEAGQMNSIVVTGTTDRRHLLDSLMDEGSSLVRHVFFDRAHFYRSPGSASLLPLHGIVGAVAHVLASPTTRIVDHIPGNSLTSAMLFNHRDPVDSTLAQGPVQWARWVNTSPNGEPEHSPRHHLEEMA